MHKLTVFTNTNKISKQNVSPDLYCFKDLTTGDIKDAQ